MYFSKKDIINASRIHRLNLINSITGIKPANLIGTISKDGHTNLAIFSSVIHLGSNPALIDSLQDLIKKSGEIHLTIFLKQIIIQLIIYIKILLNNHTKHLESIRKMYLNLICVILLKIICLNSQLHFLKKVKLKWV